MERIQIFTVIDMTETNVGRSGEAKQRNQQANYNTVVQTAGLRVNPMPIALESKVGVVDGIGFGSSIKDKQRYWVFTFQHEFENALNIDQLKDDFDLVPVITGLDETALINNSAFRTKDSVETNIVFKFVDKEDLGTDK
tara:strand:- start:1129 stop:1545 length:417 start_codon:yes stop_codon:yes gene_type:complete